MLKTKITFILLICCMLQLTMSCSSFLYPRKPKKLLNLANPIYSKCEGKITNLPGAYYESMINPYKFEGKCLIGVYLELMQMLSPTEGLFTANNKIVYLKFYRKSSSKSVVISPVLYVIGPYTYTTNIGTNTVTAYTILGYTR